MRVKMKKEEQKLKAEQKEKRKEKRLELLSPAGSPAAYIATPYIWEADALTPESTQIISAIKNWKKRSITAICAA